MQKDVLAMIPEIISDNALLVSNLYANLAGMYRMNGKLELAKENLEQAISPFQKAIEIYEMVFEFEPDMIEAKKQEL